MIMMILFWCQLVSRQQKIWATQQAFSWGNVSIFCIFAPSHHGYQRPQYFYFSLAPSPILKDLWNFEMRVGWFTLVYHCWLVYPCREFSMMLNISHSPLHLLGTTENTWDCYERRKSLPKWKDSGTCCSTQQNIFFWIYFRTFILSYFCCCK